MQPEIPVVTAIRGTGEEIANELLQQTPFEAFEDSMKNRNTIHVLPFFTWRYTSYYIRTVIFHMFRPTDLEYEAALEGVPFIQFGGDIGLLVAGAGLAN